MKPLLLANGSISSRNESMSKWVSVQGQIKEKRMTGTNIWNKNNDRSNKKYKCHQKKRDNQKFWFSECEENANKWLTFKLNQQIGIWWLIVQTWWLDDGLVDWTSMDIYQGYSEVHDCKRLVCFGYRLFICPIWKQKHSSAHILLHTLVVMSKYWTSWILDHTKVQVADCNIYGGGLPIVTCCTPKIGIEGDTQMVWM